MVVVYLLLKVFIHCTLIRGTIIDVCVFVGEKASGGLATSEAKAGPGGWQPAETVGRAPGDRQQHLPRDIPRPGREDRGADHRGKDRGDGDCDRTWEDCQRC